ncbi:hypothetical protein CB1_001095011 [Camelus ferus]|nr:hypothetical protein CB1_001095011 [Camelus ferus]
MAAKSPLSLHYAGRLLDALNDTKYSSPNYLFTFGMKIKPADRGSLEECNPVVESVSKGSWSRSAERGKVLAKDLGAEVLKEESAQGGQRSQSRVPKAGSAVKECSAGSSSLSLEEQGREKQEKMEVSEEYNWKEQPLTHVGVTNGQNVLSYTMTPWFGRGTPSKQDQGYVICSVKYPAHVRTSHTSDTEEEQMDTPHNDAADEAKNL